MDNFYQQGDSMDRGLYLLCCILLAGWLVASTHGEDTVLETAWCYSWSQRPTLRCPPGHVIDIHSIVLGDDMDCEEGFCCPTQVYCEVAAAQWDVELYNHITRRCQDQPGCQVTLAPEDYLLVDCSEGDSHYADYVRMEYTCKRDTTTTASTADVTTVTTVTTTGSTTTGSDVPQVDTLGLLIGVAVAVFCLILVTIVIVVVCVRRQDSKSRPAAIEQTTHQKAAANVYSSPAQFENSAFQLTEPSAPEMTLIQPASAAAQINDVTEAVTPETGQPDVRVTVEHATIDEQIDPDDTGAPQMEESHLYELPPLGNNNAIDKTESVDISQTAHAQ